MMMSSSMDLTVPKACSFCGDQRTIDEVLLSLFIYLYYLLFVMYKIK